MTIYHTQYNNKLCLQLQPLFSPASGLSLTKMSKSSFKPLFPPFRIAHKSKSRSLNSLLPMKFQSTNLEPSYLGVSQGKNDLEQTASLPKTRKLQFVSILTAQILQAQMHEDKWFPAVQMQFSTIPIWEMGQRHRLVITRPDGFSTAIQNTLFASNNQSIRIGKMPTSQMVFISGSKNIVKFVRSMISSLAIDTILTRLLSVSEQVETSGLSPEIPATKPIFLALQTENQSQFARKQVAMKPYFPK